MPESKDDPRFIVRKFPIESMEIQLKKADDLDLNFDRRRLRPVIPNDWISETLFPDQYSSPALSEDERRELYTNLTRMSALIIVAYLVITSPLASILGLPYLATGWGKFSFLSVYFAFVASRVADIISTLIMLRFGGMELNPLSDRDNISKMIPSQFQSLITVGIAGFVLNFFSTSLGNGLVLTFTLLGFLAAVSNLCQKRQVVRSRMGMAKAKRGLYKTYIVFGVMVCIASFLVFKNF